MFLSISWSMGAGNIMALLTAFSPLFSLGFVNGYAEARERILKSGQPEEAGMSATRLQQAAQILEEETRSGRVLAASILVARHGIIVLHRGSGKLSPDPARDRKSTRLNSSHV